MLKKELHYFFSKIMSPLEEEFIRKGKYDERKCRFTTLLPENFWLIINQNG